MPQKGWDAKGLLRPLWNRYNGGRDALAAAVGTTGSVLSMVNTGKRGLGYDLGRRLADELGVTVFDLGAPADAAESVEERRVVDRLRAVEADILDAKRGLDLLGPDLGELAGVVDRVTLLEQRVLPKKRRGAR